MIAKKKDFIEMDFTGTIKESGQIFDTTLKKDAEKLGMKSVSPLKICVGEGMLVKGFDEALDGKETGKSYSVELEPKKAFGTRDPRMIKTIPVSIFLEKQVNPYPGLVLNMDGVIARVSAISGGRVITDFNMPLAGKTIIYEFKINRIIESTDEKLKSLVEFFLGDKIESKVEGNKAVITGRKIENKAFKEKVKSLLNLEVEFNDEEKQKSN
jgi:FKBP-type peptidyl-prolyl cis-trans isomerase SlyD